MPDEKNPNEATSFADSLHQGDPVDTSAWVEAPAVTDRPNDTPLRGVDKPAVANTTLADRLAARQAPATKRVDGDEAENKAITKARTKRASAGS